jgi:alkyldihydroxyacetonephosphate synthase
MRRWNGWGDDSILYPLPPAALKRLEGWVGPSAPLRDAALESTLRSVPPSRLPPHPLVSVEPFDRLVHALGQSFSDWLALRSGRIPAYPDGVAYPLDEAQVQELLRYAAACGAALIPYGGGTSVAGHINPLPGRPALTLDLGRMNRLLQLDERSLLATFGAGVCGPDLEAQLRAHGLTLGHYPQSFEYSTLGGWIATRSSGQQSLRYGRIERLFAGGRIVSPAGALDLPPFPASAAGPDLREAVLGSEGRLGVITTATVRASPLPEHEAFLAVFFADFAAGQEAVRQMQRAGLPLALLRLSTAVETATTLALASHEAAIAALEALLSLRGLKRQRCMLLAGFAGQAELMRHVRHAALEIAGRCGGVHVGRGFGEQWHKNRFRTPYLRNTLWDLGYGIDTLETAVTWTQVDETLEDIETALRGALEPFGERVHVFTHLSHTYPTGSSIYTTYLFRLAQDPGETLQRWQAMKSAASRAIVAHGGTISHQHGVGVDHAPYLEAEKGPLGVALIAAAARTMDPDGMMNPGKLLA